MAAPLIVGLSGPALLPDERAFLRAVQPAGVILFRRNVEGAEALRRLVAEAREAAGTALVLADQEGGRVQRLQPPLAPRYPAAARIGALHAADPAAGVRAAWLAGHLIAADLLAFAITVPCLPVADVRVPEASDVIGDRAYSTDPAAVATLARAAADGVRAAGGVPVAKHIPGHGRSMVDSHVSLPRVVAGRDDLAADFAPFRALADLPAAMTSHLLYEAIDPARPATLSPAVVGLIRDDIGFDGLLLTDDICMGALSRDRAANALAALAAGVDVVLHCSGDLAEMERVAAALPAASPRFAARLAAAQPGAVVRPDAALREEFEALIGAAAGVGADPTRMTS